jgi:hypothetical protein
MARAKTKTAKTTPGDADEKPKEKVDKASKGKGRGGGNRTPRPAPSKTKAYKQSADEFKLKELARVYMETGVWWTAYKTAFKPKNVSPLSERVLANRWKKHPVVQAELERLRSQLEKRTEINLERVTQMLLEDRQLAHDMGQASAASQASKYIAQIHGLITDKREVKITSDIDQMSIDQLRQFLAEHSQTLKPIVNNPLPLLEDYSSEMDAEYEEVA